ncbi:pentapeptide repeat-containing protein [Synechococcus sp. PCC 7336]|uniref:pentapeptide repeat-containing protein n=1 Tax=Synechococcus sp. PCC 7336 TaxID=195250 RepID=UPI00034C6B0F|nr:pentapeptide repeat-containing protein [Synechococcus sp. PCC 7336]
MKQSTHFSGGNAVRSPLDFRGQNLRGRSFKGQDLRGADFSDADIRGANFVRANFTGANFSNVTAGLQRRWFLSLLALSVLFAAISGVMTAFAGILALATLETALANPKAPDSKRKAKGALAFFNGLSIAANISTILQAIAQFST